jgi:hypothetical protein
VSAAPDAKAVELALEAAGVRAGVGPFPEVAVAWSHGAFRLRTEEEVALPPLGDGAAMEVQLETRALARKWQVRWAGRVGAAGVRVSYGAEVPMAAGEPPAVAGALLQEVMARVHVAHVLGKQRASQIAWAHAGRGGWAHESVG